MLEHDELKLDNVIVLISEPIIDAVCSIIDHNSRINICKKISEK